MGDRMILNGHHGAGAAGMHRGADIALRLSKLLSFEYLFADGNQWLGRGTDVLLQGNDQLFRDRCHT